MMQKRTRTCCHWIRSRYILYVVNGQTVLINNSSSQAVGLVTDFIVQILVHYCGIFCVACILLNLELSRLVIDNFWHMSALLVLLLTSVTSVAIDVVVNVLMFAINVSLKLFQN